MQLIIVIAELWKQQTAAFCPSFYLYIYLLLFIFLAPVLFLLSQCVLFYLMEGVLNLRPHGIFHKNSKTVLNSFSLMMLLLDMLQNC